MKWTELMAMANPSHHQVWTEQQFRAAAERALHRVAPSWPAADRTKDNVLQSDLEPQDADRRDLERSPAPRAAAVLVPVVIRTQLSVLLTQRAADLPNHAGQISFPGGKIERSDAGPMAAALREAEEEIGLQPHMIEPLGYLDGYLTGTNFYVVPIVAMIKPDFSLKLNPGEVDEAFEVPLSFLMDEANHEIQTRLWQDRIVSYYVMAYLERFIWGATAGMIRNMHERFKKA